MKLQFIVNTKVERLSVLIGKNGHLRFKNAVVEKYGMVKNDRYTIAYDEDEVEKKHLFLFKSENGGGFKLCYANKSYSICALTAIQHLKINCPVVASIESCEQDIDGKIYHGLKLSF